MMFGESFSFISVAYRDDLILPSFPQPHPGSSNPFFALAVTVAPTKLLEMFLFPIPSLRTWFNTPNKWMPISI